jgi:hypothetical protein
VDLASFDDDAACAFIAAAADAQIAGWPVDMLVTLCQALLDGACVDEDEDAILKLIRNQDVCKRRRVLHTVGYDRFDEMVDGAQWGELLGLFQAADAAQCP